MKKIFLSLMALTLLSSVSFANCNQGCEKMPAAPNCGCKNESTCEKAKNNCNNPCDEKKSYKYDCEKRCDKCQIEDDEYCVYNQCFFDKKFRKMKRMLCLSSKQESCIDNIYKSYKIDMENLHSKYRCEKNKLLVMIECGNDCYREQVSVLKDLKREAKEKSKEFKSDIKEQLCKSQYSELRKFFRQEKRKMKKIVKYGAIYKLPCSDCCNK